MICLREITVGSVSGLKKRWAVFFTAWSLIARIATIAAYGATRVGMRNMGVGLIEVTGLNLLCPLCLRLLVCVLGGSRVEFFCPVRRGRTRGGYRSAHPTFAPKIAGIQPGHRSGEGGFYLCRSPSPLYKSLG